MTEAKKKRKHLGFPYSDPSISSKNNFLLQGLQNKSFFLSRSSLQSESKICGMKNRACGFNVLPAVYWTSLRLYAAIRPLILLSFEV